MSEVGWGEGGVGVPVTLINSRGRGNSERFDGLINLMIDGHGKGFRNGKPRGGKKVTSCGVCACYFWFFNFKSIHLSAFSSERSGTSDRIQIVFSWYTTSEDLESRTDRSVCSIVRSRSNRSFLLDLHSLCHIIPATLVTPAATLG